MGEPDELLKVDVGETVFDGEGHRLRTVRGFDEHGFDVTTEDGIRALSAEHVTAGSAGEAELTWRCWACGEMGDVEAIPDACPNCGAEREESYYWIED